MNIQMTSANALWALIHAHFNRSIPAKELLESQGLRLCVGCLFAATISTAFDSFLRLAGFSL
jgi:hypothetical protein